MKQYYSIGEACRICGITTRTLRYYEEIGLVSPDRTDQDSGYRYYTITTLRYVQNVRYLAEQGFSLKDIKATVENNDLRAFRDLFLEQIQETQNQIDFYHQRKASLKDWCGLLLEGEHVLKHRKLRPCVRFMPEHLYFVYERRRRPGEKNSDVYLETEFFTHTKQGGHSMVDVGGGCNLMYDSYEERMAGTYQKQSMLQVVYDNYRSTEGTRRFGGFNVIAAYHVGDPERMADTYRKMLKWAEQHSFTLRGDCIERKVLNLYSTMHSLKDARQHVTEIILPIDEDAEAQSILYQWDREA